MNAPDTLSHEQLTLADTHEVLNVGRELADFDMYRQDAALVEAVQREGAAWADAALGEFGIAVSHRRRATDDVFEKVSIRSGDVQHEVAHRVRLLVGTPPQVLLAQNVETFPDLDRELVDHSSRDVL